MKGCGGVRSRCRELGRWSTVTTKAQLWAGMRTDRVHCAPGRLAMVLQVARDCERIKRTACRLDQPCGLLRALDCLPECRKRSCTKAGCLLPCHLFGARLP